MEIVAVLLIAALVGLSVWFVLARRSIAAEAARAHEQRLAEGTLPPGADASSFQTAWERAHAPRTLGYAIAALAGMMIGLPVLHFLVASFSGWAWIAFQMPEAVEPGTIIELFARAVIVVALAVALIAWPLVLRYHNRRPGRFEVELASEIANRKP